jgi:hypothetical protein
MKVDQGKGESKISKKLCDVIYEGSFSVSSWCVKFGVGISVLLLKLPLDTLLKEKNGEFHPSLP